MKDDEGEEVLPRSKHWSGPGRVREWFAWCTAVKLVGGWRLEAGAFSRRLHSYWEKHIFLVWNGVDREGWLLSPKQAGADDGHEAELDTLGTCQEVQTCSLPQDRRVRRIISENTQGLVRGCNCRS